MTALSVGTTFTEFSARSRGSPIGRYRLLGQTIFGCLSRPPGGHCLADTIRNRHRSNFEVDYPSGNNQAPLLDIRTLSSAIYLAAVLDLEAGRADDASRKIASGLAVSASLGEEPELIAQLIRIAVAMTQFQAVQRVITEAQPSKAALAALARSLAEHRTPDPMRIGLLGELRHFNTVLFVAGEGRPSPWMDRSRAWAGHGFDSRGFAIWIRWDICWISNRVPGRAPRRPGSGSRRRGSSQSDRRSLPAGTRASIETVTTSFASLA